MPYRIIDLRIFYFTIAASVSISAIFLAFYFAPIVDVVVGIDIAHRLSQGQELYKDILVLNLPYQYFFRQPVVYLVKYMDVPMAFASSLYTLGWIILCLYATYPVMIKIVDAHKTTPPLTEERLNNTNKRLLVFTFLAYTFGLLCYTMKQVQFSQKEHLIAMCLFPYITDSLLRTTTNTHINRPKSHAILRGIMLATALSFKPMYIVVVLFSESFLVATHKNIRILFRTETIVAASFCILFILATWETLNAYVTIMLEQWLQIYKEHDEDSRTLAWMWLTILGSAFIYPALSYQYKTAKQQTPYRRGVYYLLVVMCSCVVPVWIQGKWWYYHIMPALYVGVLLLFYLSTRPNADRIFRYLSITLAIATLSGIPNRTPNIDETKIVSRVIDNKLKQHNIMGNNIYWAFDLLDLMANRVTTNGLDKTITGRYIFTWSLRGLNGYKNTIGKDEYYYASLSKIIDLFNDDISTYRPMAIVAESNIFNLWAELCAEKPDVCARNSYSLHELESRYRNIGVVKYSIADKTVSVWVQR